MGHAALKRIANSLYAHLGISHLKRAAQPPLFSAFEPTLRSEHASLPACHHTTFKVHPAGCRQHDARPTTSRDVNVLTLYRQRRWYRDSTRLNLPPSASRRRGAHASTCEVEMGSEPHETAREGTPHA